MHALLITGIKKRPLPPTPSGLRARSREEENDYDVPANSQVHL